MQEWLRSSPCPSLCKDSRGPGLPSAQCRAGCGHSVPFLETVPRSSSRRELPSTVSPGALCCLTPPRPKNRHMIQVWPIRTPGSPGLSDWRSQLANGKRWGHVGFPTELLRGSPSCCRRGEPPSALRTAEPQGGWSPGPAWAGSKAPGLPVTAPAFPQAVLASLLECWALQMPNLASFPGGLVTRFMGLPQRPRLQSSLPRRVTIETSSLQFPSKAHRALAGLLSG